LPSGNPPEVAIHLLSIALMASIDMSCAFCALTAAITSGLAAIALISGNTSLALAANTAEPMVRNIEAKLAFVNI
jgi:hypothetical protein